MAKLRVAVVGAGILGSRHARVFSEQADVQLVAIADVNPERRQVADRFGCRFYQDVQQLLAGEPVDALAIATPDHLHAAPVLAAIRAGKHVLVEKPLATTAADVQAIVAAANESSSTVMVNYSQRYVTDHVWMKQALEAGKIGRVEMVVSVKFDTLSVPTGMIRGWSVNTSPIFFMSSHDLDLVTWFLGKPPIEVYAQEVRGTLDGLGLDVHDGLNALVQFEGGVAMALHTSWIHPNSYPRVADGYMQIVGSAGAIMYNNRTRSLEYFDSRGGQRIDFTGPHTADEVGGKITGAFLESVRHFVTCIADKTEPQTSPRRTAAVTLAQAAIIESLRNRKPVTLGDIGRP